VSPDGLEILDDTNDSDCDGGLDSFRFVSIDSRSSTDAVGPRIGASGDSFYVTWLAEEFNQGSGTEFDGGMILEFDAEDPTTGEIDFFGFGTTNNTQGLASKFDFVTNSDYWMIGRGGVNGTNRSLTVTLVDRATQTLTNYTETVNTSDTWDDIQIGYTSSGNLTLIACGLGATGLQVLQASVPAFLQGQGVYSQPEIWTADICEYNDFTGSFYIGDSGAETLRYFAYYAEHSEFQVYNTDTSIEIADIEVARSATDYTTALSFDQAGKSYFYFFNTSTSTGTSTSLSMVDLDAATSPSNGSLACAVASNGDLYLYYANIGNNDSITNVALDPGVPVDECAIAATNGAKVAVSVRSGDNFYIGFAEYP
jgi:hypothetical protein